MELKINQECKLSTGQLATGVIVSLFNSKIDVGIAKITSSLSAWSSQQNKDDKMEGVALFKDADNPVVRTLKIDIPQEDIDACVAAGNFSVIGTKYPEYITGEIASLTGVDEANVEILNLI